MILNISNLLRKKVTELPFELVYNKDVLERDDFSIRLKSPLRIKGMAYYSGEIVSVIGNISVMIEAQCSRCLVIYDYPINVDFDEKFSKSPDEDENYPIVDDDIDLTDMVIENIIISMPLKPLCSEECRGLCLTCGTNLNESKCDCEKDDINPKFAALKDLFKGD